MLKIDTSGEFAEIEARGDAQELGKEIAMIAASVAKSIARGGVMDRINAIVMLKTIGTMLADDDFIATVIESTELDIGIVAIAQKDGETEEEARTRAKLTAMQRFTQARPIKVDENYNIIKESEDEEE